MKTTLHFGKISYNNRRENEVTIDVELRSRGGEPTFTYENGVKTPTGKTTPEYVELSICGDIWNRLHTDILCGGQCLDTIAYYRDQLNDPELFDVIYDAWKCHHLNGMHAGTPEQEAAIKAWEAAGNKYEYTAACNMLKAAGLYTVNYTGKSTGRYYNNEPYTYGTAWIIEELPGDVLIRIEHIITAANA